MDYIEAEIVQGFSLKQNKKVDSIKLGRISNEIRPKTSNSNFENKTEFNH